MKAPVTLLVALLPGAASAHPGHLTEVAGHDHLLAGVAIAIAIGVAVLGALKGRKDVEIEAEADEARTDQEPQEA